MNDGQEIAYCGLVCSTCPIHIATLENEEQKRLELRRNIVSEIRQKNHEEVTIEQLTDCDGCHTDGPRIYPSCARCAIRACARQKALENCSFCQEYPCDKLYVIFRSEQGARGRLDEMRQDRIRLDGA